MKPVVIKFHDQICPSGKNQVLKALPSLGERSVNAIYGNKKKHNIHTLLKLLLFQLLA